jgi:hypothetical protein
MEKARRNLYEDTAPKVRPERGAGVSCKESS